MLPPRATPSCRGRAALAWPGAAWRPPSSPGRCTPTASRGTPRRRRFPRRRGPAPSLRPPRRTRRWPGRSGRRRRRPRRTAAWRSGRSSFGKGRGELITYVCTDACCCHIHPRYTIIIHNIPTTHDSPGKSRAEKGMHEEKHKEREKKRKENTTPFPLLPPLPTSPTTYGIPA